MRMCIRGQADLAISENLRDDFWVVDDPPQGLFFSAQLGILSNELTPPRSPLKCAGCCFSGRYCLWPIDKTSWEGTAFHSYSNNIDAR